MTGSLTAELIVVYSVDLCEISVESLKRSFLIVVSTTV